MNKIRFVYFMLVFGQCFAMEQLDPATLKDIDDIYDKEAFKQVKCIEKYFALEQPASFDDSIKLQPEEGQMEKGYQLIMTPGKPLKIRGNWGTYTVNNCSTQEISEEDMTALIKKKFGAQLTGYQFNGQTKSQVFALSKFEGQLFPEPISRKSSQFVQAEEARHAFNVLSDKHADEDALQELKSESQTESVVKEWQPISRKHYKSVDNVQPVYWIPYLGKIKAVLSSWYIWK